METQPPQPGETASKSSEFAGSSSNTSVIGTQEERRHQLGHSDAANAATRNMTLDAPSKTVSKTGCSENKKQFAVGWKYMHLAVNSHQLPV